VYLTWYIHCSINEVSLQYQWSFIAVSMKFFIACTNRCSFISLKEAMPHSSILKFSNTVMSDYYAISEYGHTITMQVAHCNMQLMIKTNVTKFCFNKKKIKITVLPQIYCWSSIWCALRPQMGPLTFDSAILCSKINIKPTLHLSC